MPFEEQPATTALDAAHRSSIYHSLMPILGEEDANVLLSEFPSAEGDELVTKDFLRAELAALRTEMHQGSRRQTAWFTGVVLTSLFGGLAASAAITQALG